MVLMPVLNDLAAGIIKLGDLVNSVKQKPKLTEFEVFLYNLFAYGSPQDSLDKVVIENNIERKEHTLENLEIINQRLEALIGISRNISELKLVVEILADFFYELKRYMLKVIE
jgi:hypothetical protein